MNSCLPRIQQSLKNLDLDGWLIVEAPGTNPLFSLVTEVNKQVIRRAWLFIPATGAPSLLASSTDLPHFTHLPYKKTGITSWQDTETWIRTTIAGTKKIAMEYSPAFLPDISRVDAGTIELIRSFGQEIVSSADLYQASFCTWTPEQCKSHQTMAQELDSIRAGVFTLITHAVRNNEHLTEYDVQQEIIKEFNHRSLVITDGEPIVAVNQNSRFPHYFPTKETAALITENCWVLLDIWGRHSDPESVYADSTWVAYTGEAVPKKHQEIFTIVTTARDLVVQTLQSSWEQGLLTKGYELDRIARDYITKQGYGQTFTHTTGHSLGSGNSVHAAGVGLNDLSIHDTRLVQPNSGFTIEPGIYLPEFGMRTEIDVYMDPVKGPIITTELQTEIPHLI